MDALEPILKRSVELHQEYEALYITVDEKIVVSTTQNATVKNSLYVNDTDVAKVKEDVSFYANLNYLDKAKDINFKLIVDLNDKYLLQSEKNVQFLVVKFMLYFIFVVVFFLIVLYFLNIYPLMKLSSNIRNKKQYKIDFFIKEHSFLYNYFIEKYNEVIYLNKTLEEKVADRTALLLKTNNLLKEAQHLSRIGSWERGVDDDLLIWSDEMFEIFELELKSIAPTYKVFMNYVHYDDREELNNTIQNAIKNKSDYSLTYRVLIRGNLQKVIYEKGKLEYDDIGNVKRLIGTAQDITQRYKTSKELEFQAKLLNSVTDSIFVHDLDGNFIYVNEAAYTTRGYTKEEMLQMRVEELDYHDEKSGSEIYEENMINVKAQLSKQQKAVVEVSHKVKDGKTIPIEITCKLIQDKGKGYIISIARDISELKIMNENLQKMAITDNLTGIYNRHKFEEIIKIEMERSYRFDSPLSLIMVDIDHFKRVNDTYGHDEGDNVIKNIVDIISENIRHLDIFVRWGGEEFIVLCPQTESNGAAVLAEKLRGTVESKKIDVIGNITCSFGVTSYIKDEGKSAFIKRLDGALYRAKDEGRNRVITI